MALGELLQERKGPLPVWAWAALGIGVALAVAVWRANKTAADQANTDSNTGNASTTGVDLIGGNQTPPFVLQDYTTVINTPPGVPPGAGRHHPPTTPPPTTTPPAPPTTTTPPPTTTPTTPTSNPAPPQQPRGTWVTVAKFTTKNPPWNSTVSGIAGYYYGKSGSWQRIWSDPANASLVSRRKDPKFIQPGDRIWVPLS